MLQCEIGTIRRKIRECKKIKRGASLIYKHQNAEKLYWGRIKMVQGLFSWGDRALLASRVG